MDKELKSIFQYLLDFVKHPEEYNDDMIALLKVEQVVHLLNYIDKLNNELQQRDYVLNKIEEYIEQERNKIKNHQYARGIRRLNKIEDIINKRCKNGIMDKKSR